MKKFVQFLKAQKLVTNEDVVFSSRPHKDTPWWICLWILVKCVLFLPLGLHLIPPSCDVIDVDGNPVPKPKQVPTYAHAQKMRAAMMYTFGRIHRLGSVPWQEGFPGSGRMLGNPSVSEIVSSYMVSLRRRKARLSNPSFAGETSISSRAITPEILLNLYNYNNSNGRSTVQRMGTTSARGSWCGARTLLMLHAALTVGFACLLRFDEVLHIQITDITFLLDKHGKKTVAKLMLRTQKTSQFGGIKPFYLHLLPVHEAHLCPFRALCFWISASRIRTGHLFRTITKHDQVSIVNKLMSTTAFLELFRNNLLDIDIDPAPYGTHSVRRGGVQYLLLFKRAGLRHICEWGGWSTDFTSTSVLRYIISVSDDVQLNREDFLNPNRPLQLTCHTCGRNCNCF
ncbi:DNA breaking-rejoining enzyme [Mycena latifolia]|nr:DNA breaking-rejoining enzyme [Mycena latifolia]